MPMYDYECPICEWADEIQCKIADRGKQSCPVCSSRLPHPLILQAPAHHGPAYQMKAVLSNGEHIKGHFGKEAKRRKDRTGK